MPPIIEQINQQIIAFLKAHDSVSADALRMVKAAVKEKEIASKKELNDEDVVGVLRNQVKTREDSIAEFVSAGRNDLADKERKEIDVIKKFLPPDMDAAELASIVNEVIAETGATTKADMGRVMGAVMARVKGKAGGEQVKKIVMENLK